jgi:hypothetical protein
MELPYLALSFTVDPATRSIAGEAHHIVRAAAPLDRLAFDLDPRFTIHCISVDGHALRSSAWNNPDGLLTITPPAPLMQGAEARVVIRWSGTPHIALNAPWDGGFVWSRAPANTRGAASRGSPPHPAAGLRHVLALPRPCGQARRPAGPLRAGAGAAGAAGNGRLIGEEHANGWATWRWRARMPQSYGVTLQIGPYELAEDSYASRHGNMSRSPSGTCPATEPRPPGCSAS